MYKYENAEMEIVKFACEDVITTSNTNTTETLPDNWLPIG